MTHYFNLNSEPFEKIANGSKTIELRLLDEKRQALRVNDKIEFLCDRKKITCIIKALHKYKSFEELYNNLDLLKCGYDKNSIKTAHYTDMLIYYSEDKIRKYGVVGIEIDLINKVVVFDLGGTLMEFRDMPPVWIDYYKTGFERVNKKFNLNLTYNEINKSAEIMKSYNPRVNYREEEIVPQVIFADATSFWNTDLNINTIIEAFFDCINLNTIIYDYTFDLIEKYRANGYKIACLTDLPSGMSDYIFKKPLKALVGKFDLYVSSQSCGYRKPNKFGLEYIANYFNTDINNLLFIGDEEKDKQAATNAGCKFKFIGDML